MFFDRQSDRGMSCVRELSRRRGARVLLLSSVLGVTLSLLAGCSWFSASTKPVPSELVPLNGKSVVTSLWTVSLGAAGVGFRPVSAGDAVLAASADGTVLRVDAKTGQVIWRQSLPHSLVAGIGSDGDTAVVAARDGSLIALDSTGKTRWSVALGTEVVTVPAAGQGLVVVRSSDNRVSAFELDSGKRRWTLQRQAPTLMLRQTGAISIDGSTVYVGLPGGRILALSAQTGAVRWEAAVTQARGSNEIERIADVVAAPVVSGRDVCAASFQGRLACFEASTGRGLWVREISSVAGLDLDSVAAYVIDDKDQLHAYSRSGTSLWRNDKFSYRGLTRPLASGPFVLVGDRSGYVHAVTREDGALAGRIATDGSAILGGPIQVDRTLVVQTSAGSLVGFSAQP
jgi:outer membrane protein assembly factor BamB